MFSVFYSLFVSLAGGDSMASHVRSCVGMLCVGLVACMAFSRHASCPSPHYRNKYTAFMALPQIISNIFDSLVIIFA